MEIEGCDIPGPILEWLKQNRYQLVAAECECVKPVMGMAPGYKGRENPACLRCCPKCPRCKLPSTDNDYNEGVCYGCASGDNDSASSSEKEEPEEEEPPMKKALVEQPQEGIREESPLINIKVHVMGFGNINETIEMAVDKNTTIWTLFTMIHKYPSAQHSEYYTLEAFDPSTVGRMVDWVTRRFESRYPDGKPAFVLQKEKRNAALTACGITDGAELMISNGMSD
jgi:hypothetical protein